MTDFSPLDDAITGPGRLTAIARAAAGYFAARSEETSPYDLCAHLYTDWQGEPPALRLRGVMMFYARFLDRGVLIVIGSAVFKVTRRVLRTDIQRARAAMAAKS